MDPTQLSDTSIRVVVYYSTVPANLLIHPRQTKLHYIVNKLKKNQHIMEFIYGTEIKKKKYAYVFSIIAWQ